MRGIWTLGGGLATAASLAIAAVALRPSSTPASPATPSPRPAAVGGSPRFAPQGAGSCAAAACHGSASPLPPQLSTVLRNEHTTWITGDPHALAFQVLSDERSERIARNLGKGASHVPATEDARCLACHATPTAHIETIGEVLADTIRRDGVGCESCHGDSGAWLGEHTKYDWDNLSAIEKDRTYNLTNLRDLNVRAQTCAGCHVGAPADPSRGLPLRDVNHDLIAAGHPRLNWEFSAYVANYPKHWKQKDGTDDGDARLWKVGQVATLRASADLLEDRASRAEAGQAPWPELSEYGCFSCHFSLKEEPFRGRRDPETPLGVPSWASWNRALLPVVLDPRAKAFGVEEKVAALNHTMGAVATDPRAVASLSASLRGALDHWLGEVSATRFDRAALADLVKTLDAKDDRDRRVLVSGWDSAAQVYLAIAAAHASLGAQGAADPALRAELESFLEDLGFPKGYDSPRDADPARAK